MLNCRSCDSHKLVSIIPLGKLPLANALLGKKNDNEGRHNLEVMICEDCGLAQLKDLIDPKDLFSDYVYFSSNSDAMLDSVAKLADRLAPNLSSDSLVVEIASNDGYLLKNYVGKGIPVLGIDPAENIAKFANENGVPTLCRFFGAELAQELSDESKKADVIHANNVMAHVPDINGFIRGLKVLLKDNGIAVIEVPHFLDFVQKYEFDTIYHEHVYYFSLQALLPAFKRHGLDVYDVEKIALHGGSLRLFVAHTGARDVSANVSETVHQEEVADIHNPEIYANFMTHINTLSKQLKDLLMDVKSQGGKIAAYGASAKGTTLLNYFGVTSDLLDFVVDRSPVKQGLHTPGTQLEIKAPSALLDEKVTHALLLSWNFAEEILRQQSEYIQQGGKFILPLPEVKIIG